MLQCTHCHLALRAHIENDVEIDICDSCHGVWLDHGGLEIISNGIRPAHAPALVSM